MSSVSDLSQRVGANLSHTAMLESSTVHCPADTLTDLRIWSIATTEGRNLLTAARHGIVGNLWLSRYPMGADSHGTPEPRRSQAIDYSLFENVRVGMRSVTRRKTSRENSASGRI
jgi:hypothetical protein